MATVASRAERPSPSTRVSHQVAISVAPPATIPSAGAVLGRSSPAPATSARIAIQSGPEKPSTGSPGLNTSPWPCAQFQA